MNPPTFRLPAAMLGRVPEPVLAKALGLQVSLRSPMRKGTEFNLFLVSDPVQGGKGKLIAQAIMRLATAILAEQREQRELQKRLVTAALAALRRLISKKSKLHLSAYTLNGGLGASRYHVLSARLHSKAGRGN